VLWRTPASGQQRGQQGQQQACCPSALAVRASTAGARSISLDTFLGGASARSSPRLARSSSRETPKPEKSAGGRRCTPMRSAGPVGIPAAGATRCASRQYQRLLATRALRYFAQDIRLADIDRRALQGFIGWLADRPGRTGSRLSDRSIRNALTPLRLCLEAAAAEGLVKPGVGEALTLPRRRGGRRWEFTERRFLTREALGMLLEEIPPAHKPLFLLLASTGLRISETIALRWCDLDLDARPHDCGYNERSSTGCSVRRSPATALARSHSQSS
jgi:hypothetical protein